MFHSHQRAQIGLFSFLVITKMSVAVHATIPFQDGFEYSSPDRSRYANRPEDVGRSCRNYDASSLPGGSLPESDPYDRWMTSATIVSRPDGPLPGNASSLKVELGINDMKANNAHRAEVSHYMSLSNVQSRIYSTRFSIYVPDDASFETDSQGETLFQWFPQLDYTNFGESYGHPPMHLYAQNGNWVIDIRGTSQQVNTNGASYYAAYDLNKTIYQTAYQKGVWTNWTFNVLWSPYGYGQIQVYKDNQLKVNYHGIIGHNNTAPGAIAEKFGIYKWDWNDNLLLNNYSYRSIYFDSYANQEGAVDPTIRVYDGLRSTTSGWSGGYANGQSLIAGANFSVIADDGAWTGSWNGYANMLQATDQGLEYQRKGMKLWTRSGAAITSANPTCKFVSRNMPAHQNSEGSLYYSFLLDFSILPTSTHELSVGLTSSLNGGSPSANYISMLNVEANGQVRLIVNGSQSSPLFMLDDQVHLFVVRHDFNVSGESDRTTLWVDPQIGQVQSNPSDSSYVFQANGLLNMTDKFTVFHSPWSDAIFNGNYRLDEIRVGTTWASVTPAHRVVNSNLLLYDAAASSPNYTASSALNLPYEYNRGESICSSHNVGVTARHGQWAGFWSGDANMLMAYDDPANSLQYVDFQGRQLLTGKGYFATAANPSRYVVLRPITAQTAAATDRVFYSFLVRFTDLTMDSSDQLFVGLTGDPGSGSPSLAYVSMLAVKSNQRAYALTNGSWGTDSFLLSENTTYLILGMLEWNVGGTLAERTKIWINPVLDGFDPASTAVLNRDQDVVGSLEQISSFSIMHGWRTGVWTGAYCLDEIRIGLTWESVLPQMYLLDTPIINPEPSSVFILLVISSLMFPGYRQVKRSMHAKD